MWDRLIRMVNLKCKIVKIVEKWKKNLPVVAQMVQMDISVVELSIAHLDSEAENLDFDVETFGVEMYSVVSA